MRLLLLLQPRRSNRRLPPLKARHKPGPDTLNVSGGTAIAREPGSRKPARRLLLAQVLLSCAILGAGYLAWFAITNGPLAGCGTGSGCHKVLQSQWAYWLNIPVSLPALLVYAALLGATILARRQAASPDDERGAWAAIVTLSVVVAGAALWFVGLQVFVLKAFCPFCMAAHACGFAAALLCLSKIPLATDPATPMWSAGSGKRGLPRHGVFSLVLIGLAGAGVLAGGQVLFPKQRNLVAFLPAGPARATTNVAVRSNAPATQATPAARLPALPPSPNAQLVAPRLLSLYTNQFFIKLDDVPMIGSPDAPHIIVYLFDYTCPHCRDLHGILADAQRQLSNELAIVSLPMPMSTNCNPLIPAHFLSSSNSCDYARLGLAVWLAKPEVQCQYNDWFFTPEKPVSVAEARDYAVRLVGADALEAALANPRLQEQITTDCLLHYANWQATGRPTMPQLILGQAVSLGPLNSVEHLFALLGRYLGMDTSLNRVRSAPPANSPAPK